MLVTERNSKIVPFVVRCFVPEQGINVKCLNFSVPGETSDRPICRQLLKSMTYAIKFLGFVVITAAQISEA
jgi:hypothetical protein